MLPRYTGEGELCPLAAVSLIGVLLDKKKREFGCWGRQLADAATLEKREILKLQNTFKF